jgi:GNAT superfamily N-acetyltransferase
MIVDLDLVSRVESAIAGERRAFALGSQRERPQGAVMEVSQGLAVFTGAELFSNRVFGMGVGGPVDSDDLDRIEDFYRQRGASPQIEVSSLAGRSFLTLLADRRYRMTRFHNIYATAPGAATRPADAVEIRMVDDTNASEWSDVLIDGFGYDDPTDRAAVARWNRGLLDTDDVHAFVGRLGGSTAGSASVYIDGDTAVLGGAATLPISRRKGVQSALIAARLELATTIGCELAVVTADPDSTSGRNAERAGFQLVCTHSVFAIDRA